MNEVNVNFEEIIAMAKTELSKNKMHVENYDLNVLIAGSTGVGKSTLINTVFGKKVAITGQGAPITQQITKYSLENGLSIYDTKGLEMNADSAKKLIIALGAGIGFACSCGSWGYFEVYPRGWQPSRWCDKWHGRCCYNWDNEADLYSVFG